MSCKITSSEEIILLV